MVQNVEVGLTSRAEETLRPRNKWHQWFDRGTVMTSSKFQTRILHLNLLGKILAENLYNLRFLQTVKIRIVISLLFSSIFSLRNLYNSSESI